MHFLKRIAMLRAVGVPSNSCHPELAEGSCGCPWLFVAGVRASLRQSGIEIFAVLDPGFPNIRSTLGYPYAVPTALAPWLRRFRGSLSPACQPRSPKAESRRGSGGPGRVFERSVRRPRVEGAQCQTSL